MRLAELEFLKYLSECRTGFLNTFFEAITALGEEALIIVVMATVYYVFDKKLAQKVFFITMVSLSANGIVKNIARVPRPFALGEILPVRGETATGYSFPSGHTQNFSTWSMALSLHFKKKFAIVLSLFLSLLVAFSRMYLGVHYPSDVIVGLALGLGFAVVGNILYDKVQNKNLLYILSSFALTPFMIAFLALGDPLFEDFFKFYGLFVGLALSVVLEEKYIRIENGGKLWHRILRVAIGVAVAFSFKEGLKELFYSLEVSSLPRVALAFDSVRYFVIAVAEILVCPLLFKKIKI